MSVIILLISRFTLRGGKKKGRGVDHQITQSKGLAGLAITLLSDRIAGGWALQLLIEIFAFIIKILPSGEIQPLEPRYKKSSGAAFLSKPAC